MNFSVLTWNIWGLPFGLAPNKTKRIEAICDALLKASSDVLCLQEVWTKNDYLKIKEKLRKTYPFYHYFHSGVIGSGLCVFSKWPIEETFYYQFPLNGFFHMIAHCDWYSGKGVALTRIKLKDFKLNVYNTHLHANYSNSLTNDPYHIHRLIQSFDTSQFVRNTLGNADLCIVVGDFNSVRTELCFKLLCDLAGLEDVNKISSLTKTKCLNDNQTISSCNNDEIIDYILVKKQNPFMFEICESSLKFDFAIPGSTINYSDHPAVFAEFLLPEINTKITDECSNDETDGKSIQKTLETSMDICKKHMQSVITSIRVSCFSVLLLFFLMLILGLFFNNLPFMISYIVVIVLFICFKIASIISNMQMYSWIKNAKKRLKICILNYKNKNE